MKARRLSMAVVLSASMILGSFNLAHAMDPAPAATLTLATYNSQVAIYDSSLAAFDSATATLKIDLATYESTTHVQMVAYAQAMKTYRAIIKTNSPAKSSAQYAQLMAAYNTARSTYNAAAMAFKIQSSLIHIAASSFRTAYQSVLQGYQVVYSMRDQLTKAIYFDFATAIQRANTAFATAMSGAVSDTQRIVASNKHRGSIVAAVATRKNALDALGSKLVKPVKTQVKVSANTAPIRPTRPSEPAYLSPAQKSS